MTETLTQIRKLRPEKPEALSRRGFLACSGSAACALCASLCAPRVMKAQAAAAPASPLRIPQVKARIRLVFSHPAVGVQGWPNVGYDFEGKKTEYSNILRTGCPNIEFLPAPVPRTAEDVSAIMAGDSEVDGYVLCLLGLPGSPVGPIPASGRPVVVVNDLYGGGIGTMRGPKVALVSTSNSNDIVTAVRTFETIKRLRSSVLLNVTNRDRVNPAGVMEDFGTQVQMLNGDDLDGAYKKADASQADTYAKGWIRKAEKVIEPTPEEIGKSGRMYIAMRDLLAARNAQGIAVDCLQLFYGGKMTAYPCLGFCQLNDDGFVGACEADLQSAITMLVMTYLTGRPGYISDPVIDTSKNRIIYAHCVAPTKVFGPRGTANPYHIRSHSEDRKGASMRSLMPLGQVVTSLKFIPGQKTVVMHTAKTVANIDDDKACRTKLAADIPNGQKMLEGWTQGWHRVTVYGDYRNRVMTLSALLGIKVVEEG
jgi:hypothetical protein